MKEGRSPCEDILMDWQGNRQWIAGYRQWIACYIQGITGSRAILFWEYINGIFIAVQLTFLL